MMEKANQVTDNYDKPEEMNKAIANIAYRLTELEQVKPMEIPTGGGDAAKLGATLTTALRDLKTLQVAMQMGVNEIEEKLKESSRIEEENKKLKYRVLHLKRALEEAEGKSTL